ncbi:unnamed protein product [Hydatigera taeniaeformis]|uniref:SEC7 domain-containing protein n=1 Tax=Hydatigena taeniaeformis TaxID=6205 RepID=A0A0R3X2J3_HYDTA|nr:unnamed protein product [Hydatigera taeniaeformis]
MELGGVARTPIRQRELHFRPSDMVKSEVSMLLTSLKCGYRSNSRSYQDNAKRALLDNLISLRRTLNATPDLDSLNPLTYLTPFLDVIRSDATTGLITGLALTSVEKFLAYGLLEVRSDSLYASQNVIGIAAETIAEAVIQARFIRSRLSSDEVVLMKIVHLLRTLLLIPSGCLLSNVMVGEILQNCLRICLESQLSELLRRTAEQFLASIVQLFFSRLPALLLTDETSHQLGVDEEETFRISDEGSSRKGSRRPTIHTETSLMGENPEINQEVKTEESLQLNLFPCQRINYPFVESLAKDAIYNSPEVLSRVYSLTVVDAVLQNGGTVWGSTER